MICGFTQEELESCFKEQLDKFAKDKDMDYEKLLTLIEKWYGGYSWNGKDHLYNPFFILSLLGKGEFGNFWFETGTPSFLMDFIMNNNENISALFREKTIIGGGFPNFDLDYLDLTTLLLQTGYLTIKTQDIVVGELPSYELAIPNHEVNQSLFTYIIKEFSNQNSSDIAKITKKILKAITTHDNELLQNTFDTLIATIPAIQYDKIKKDIREANYHILFLACFRLMGFFTLGEVPSSKKTPDTLLKKDNLIIIYELKYDENKNLNDLVMEAIDQIKDLEYYKPYLDYDVVLLGVAFGDREVKSYIESL